MPLLDYHNYEHAKAVRKEAKFYGIMESRSPEEIFLLESAGLTHDAIMIPGRKDNEELTVTLVRPLLYNVGYTQPQIETVSELVLVTNMPTKPKNILENIICDSDLDYLGTQDYFEVSERFRKELGMSEANYAALQIKFLGNHKYYTETARRLRQPVVDRYYRMLAGDEKNAA
jgi:predicted metal-dependent HD superfamily phosphohydrolase